VTDLLVRGAAIFGCPRAEDEGGVIGSRLESELGHRLPKAAAELFAFRGLIGRIAAVFEGQTELPRSARLADSRQMPGRADPILLLLTENQGVCYWGVPMSQGDNPPVLVGGDISRAREMTVEYAPTVGHFVYAFAWDSELFAGWQSELPDHSPMIQAQARTLDSDVLDLLRGRYKEEVETHGWPGSVQRRFRSTAGLRIGLWNAEDQCDWWISAPTDAILAEELRWLIGVSNLRESLWSNDVEGEALLRDIRGR